MKKIGYCIIICLLPIFGKSQNWTKVGNGLPRKVWRLYADSNILYASTVGNSSQQNNLWKFDGVKWDTIPNPCSYWGGWPTSFTKYKGKLVMSVNCGSILSWDGVNWDTIAIAKKGVLNLYAKDNDLYAVGWFDTINGVAAHRVARYDGVQWHAIDTTRWVLGSINAVIVFNNELYIGGNMISPDGKVYRIAKWNGVKWEQVGNGIQGSWDQVFCFEVFNNELYVGGNFIKANCNPGNGIAKWDGIKWSEVGGGVSGIGVIYTLNAYDGNLYVGGGYTMIGGIFANSFAKWDGVKWCGYGTSFNFSVGGIRGIMKYNGDIYIGGEFKTINGDTMNYVAKWIGGNYVDTCGSLAGIKEQEKDIIGIELFPNPTDGTLYIQGYLKERTEVEISLYSVTGQKVFERTFRHAQGIISDYISLEQLNNGIYFIQIRAGESVIYRKIIKGE